MSTERSDEDFERRLTHALEARPVAHVPEDFALRVASKVAAGEMAARRSVRAAGSVGRRVALATVGVLLVMILALAPSAAAGSHAKEWLEAGLEIEFVALTVWLSLRSRFQP